MLLVLNHLAYAGAHVESITWNALRLAQAAGMSHLLEAIGESEKVRSF